VNRYLRGAAAGLDAATDRGYAASVDERWTLTSLLRRYPRVAAASALVVAAAVAVTILTTVGNARPQPLANSASCSQWAAATRAEQLAYSNLYIDEYGGFADTARRANEVRAQIGRACTHASYLGEADDITILAAQRHSF
jgi:hypothetical protein